MATGLAGLSPFGEQGILDATPEGVQGRNPAQWGSPQGNAQDQASPAAPTPEFAPGAEYGISDGYGLKTDIVPGEGPIITLPVTSVTYLGPADPRWQEYQQEIITARASDTHDEPYGRHLRTPSDGHPSPAKRRLQVTDSTNQYAANGTIVPSRDIWRAAEVIIHNVAKTLWVPILKYSERPFYNNIAITAPQTDQPNAVEIPGTGRDLMSPQNTYEGTGIGSQYAYNPGVTVAYEQPSEPAVTPDNSAAVSQPGMGGSWLSYG
jgi:hypothetical protein